MTEIKLPELGDGINDVEISDILVQSGNSIQEDQAIIIVETEKASMEIPTPISGIVDII